MNNWILHTVLVPKSKFTKAKAIEYIKKHYHYRTVRDQENFWRFRQVPPLPKAIYYTQTLSNGVEVIFMKKNK